MIKLFYAQIVTVIFSVAVVFNFIRLLSDVYGALVISFFQLVLVKQMYNFFAGQDMNLGGTYAGRGFAFEIRLFVFVIFFLMYFGLFFV